MTSSSLCYRVARFVSVWMLVEIVKTVLFRTNVMILHLSAAHDERLENQQHQNGQRIKRSRTMQTKSAMRTQSAIAEAATKEFKALSEFLSDLPDTDARTLALRMYYLEELELSENVSSSDAQTKVSECFQLAHVQSRGGSQHGKIQGKKH